MATFTLYLPDELAKAIDAERVDVSRSLFIRRALEAYVDPKPRPRRMPAEMREGKPPTPKDERSPELQDNPHLPQEMRERAQRELTKPVQPRPIVQKRGA